MNNWIIQHIKSSHSAFCQLSFVLHHIQNIISIEFYEISNELQLENLKLFSFLNPLLNVKRVSVYIFCIAIGFLIGLCSIWNPTCDYSLVFTMFPIWLNWLFISTRILIKNSSIEFYRFLALLIHNSWTTHWINVLNIY